MKLGALLMPSHPPEREVADGQRWDLEELERLDALGFEEAWIGEHFTAAWEPCPAPDLLIAQALQRTERIHLGPLVTCCPTTIRSSWPIGRPTSTIWRKAAIGWESASAPCPATTSSLDSMRPVT
jgi:hypothetical protein